MVKLLIDENLLLKCLFGYIFLEAQVLSLAKYLHLKKKYVYLLLRYVHFFKDDLGP